MKMRMICWLALAVLLAGLCPGGYACAEAKKTAAAPDFTLTDQYGKTHTLSDYQGKVVFLNLWATWCPYCVYEMPDIEEIYHELGENQKDVAVFGLASPAMDVTDEKGIALFLKAKKLTYPVLIDPTGEVIGLYRSSGIPVTWVIGKDGGVAAFVEGFMDKNTMLDRIAGALE